MQEDDGKHYSISKHDFNIQRPLAHINTATSKKFIFKMTQIPIKKKRFKFYLNWHPGSMQNCFEVHNTCQK